MRLSRSVVAAALVALAAATSSSARQLPQVTRRIPQFENEHVRVWKSIIHPGQPLSMHRHEHPRAIIALTGGTLKIVKDTGSSQEVTWETGQAYWLTADPPGELHGDVNEGTGPIEVMVVELQQAR